jgi:hypothetical protein
MRLCPSCEISEVHFIEAHLVIDSGHVINPHNAAEQLEGGVCWELSHAWMGGLDAAGGGECDLLRDGQGDPVDAVQESRYPLEQIRTR